MTDRVVIITGGSRGIGPATAISAPARCLPLAAGYASHSSPARPGGTGPPGALGARAVSESVVLAQFAGAAIVQTPVEAT